MSAQTPSPAADALDDDSTALTLEALASACCMDVHWVTARLNEGLLQTGDDDTTTTAWRFSSATVVRARRIAHLEVTFDADPHLAALTADLIEEVTALRRQVLHLKGN
ncbi:MAG: MerR family transcriptional regulator [Gammaproteobacteria bacterium]|jgi:chaperone modulatory protein CbpM|nr:MerR family transcriptional regulator [Gammaproteobacteria bacterium]MBU0826797.1 MerR family transcriptional regulator [Gammaproteobacteria bacterium]MBU0890504.1 MerR family transcriptional regulator [Gammaproteobacteria bacterium]MBU1351260.1 MerR family transcriptional regulator [Gammaproteobacteria bacterium]MBU1505035.1 MerR family transcriptional regulator [Gammaproteobacteria bacterium]